MPGLPCRIVLSGELSERFERAFAGLSLGRYPGRTELSGTVTDQTELHSVLIRILDLGLQILSVRVGHELGRKAGSYQPPAE